MIADKTGPDPNGQDVVLVIDDDAADLDIVQRMLTKEGYNVATARNALEGLAAARKLHPSAIVLDVLMPETDGWHVLSALKQDQDLQRCPVIVLSVNDDFQKGRNLGAAAHLQKPVDREPLLRILNAETARPGASKGESPTSYIKAETS